MSGFFPVMMFGLPAACLAMYHAAKPEKKKAVGGMLASLALTSPTAHREAETAKAHRG